MVKEHKQERTFPLKRTLLVIFVACLAICCSSVLLYQYVSDRYSETSEARKLLSSLRKGATTTNEFYEQERKLVQSNAPLTTESIIGNPIPDEENASYHMTKAAVISRILLTRSDPKRETRSNEQRIAKAVFDSQSLKKLESMPTDELHLALKKSLKRMMECKSHRSIFPSLPVGGSHAFGTIMLVHRQPPYQTIKKNANLETLALGLMFLKIGRLISYEPDKTWGHASANSHIQESIGILYPCLPKIKVPRELELRLHEELTLLDSHKPLVTRIQLDRASYIKGKSEGKGVALHWSFIDQGKLVRWFNYHVNLAQFPWHQTGNKFESGIFEPDWKTCLRSYSDYCRDHQYCNRIVAQSRCLRIFMEICKLEKLQGRQETIELDKLGLPNRITSDPFSGKALKVERDGNDWLVYSVGLSGPKGDDFIRADYTGLSGMIREIIIGVPSIRPQTDKSKL